MFDYARATMTRADIVRGEEAPVEARYATSFDEYVGWMATNSSHATVLDWGRRLECALNEYAASLRAPSRGRKAWQRIQTAITNDPHLGCSAATTLRQMRDLRNRVAHDPRVSVSPEQAADYARQALSLIWALTTLAGEWQRA